MKTLVPALVLLAATAACARRPTYVPPNGERSEREREREHERALAPGSTPSPERVRETVREASSTQELIERTEHVSRFSPDEAGLRALLAEAATAATANNEAALQRLAAEITADAERISLALTFEGARRVRPLLVGAAVDGPRTTMARLRALAGATVERVDSATGEEIAAGSAAAASFDPRFRTVGAWLRPGVRWYRVALRTAAGPLPAWEALTFAGDRWQFAESPWQWAGAAPSPGVGSTSLRMPSSVRWAR